MYKKKKKIIGIISGIVLITAMGTCFGIYQMNEKKYKEYMELSQKHFASNELQKAEEYCLKAKDIYPQKDEVVKQLYEIYLCESEEALDEGNYDQAEEKCKKAMKTNENDIKSYLLLGDMYREQNKASKEQYEKALKIDPNCADAYIGLMSECYMFNSEQIEEIMEKVQITPVEKDEKFIAYKNRYEDSKRYEAFKDLDSEHYNVNSGYNQVNDAGNIRLESYGSCFKKMVDFDGDGAKEIVYAYRPENPIPEKYRIDIWAYERGELKKVFEIAPLIKGTEYTIALVNKNGRCYLESGNVNEGTAQYFEYTEGKFVSVQLNDVKETELENFYLEGSNSDGIEYIPAMEERDRTDIELAYESKATQLALRNISETGVADGIPVQYGGYFSSEENQMVYLCSYQNTELDEPPALQIGVYQIDGMSSNAYFTWNTQKEIYENEHGYVLSVDQKGDEISLSLINDKFQENVSAQLRRDTRYDSL